ncbi:MAG: hypothetical protein H0X29_08220, partial [Parachlamydiaceae bacterium]|nr:hypothetical protein [Parachlamydiaceae bacterium]
MSFPVSPNNDHSKQSPIEPFAVISHKWGGKDYVYITQAKQSKNPGELKVKICYQSFFSQLIQSFSTFFGRQYDKPRFSEKKFTTTFSKIPVADIEVTKNSIGLKLQELLQKRNIFQELGYKSNFLKNCTADIKSHLPYNQPIDLNKNRYPLQDNVDFQTELYALPESIAAKPSEQEELTNPEPRLDTPANREEAVNNLLPSSPTPEIPLPQSRSEMLEPSPSSSTSVPPAITTSQTNPIPVTPPRLPEEPSAPMPVTSSSSTISSNLVPHPVITHSEEAALAPVKQNQIIASATLPKLTEEQQALIQPAITPLPEADIEDEPNEVEIRSPSPQIPVTLHTPPADINKPLENNSTAAASSKSELSDSESEEEEVEEAPQPITPIKANISKVEIGVDQTKKAEVLGKMLEIHDHLINYKIRTEVTYKNILQSFPPNCPSDESLEQQFSPAKMITLCYEHRLKTWQDLESRINTFLFKQDLITEEEYNKILNEINVLKSTDNALINLLDYKPSETTIFRTQPLHHLNSTYKKLAVSGLMFGLHRSITFLAENLLAAGRGQRLPLSALISPMGLM